MTTSTTPRTHRATLLALVVASASACTTDDGRSVDDPPPLGTSVGSTDAATSDADADASTGGGGTQTGAVSTTGADGSSDADADASAGDTTGAPVGCAADHVCFALDGEFFVPDEATPTASWDIELPDGAEYRVVEVELDFTHGGWFPDDPAGLHNVFWLHRGRRTDFTWLGGVLGYVNLRGPTANIVRTRHDLDVADLMQSQTFNINGAMPVEGETYHVLYRYDTTAAEVLVRVTRGADVIAEGTDVPTTDLVRNPEGWFFLQFANETDVSLPGPEVPSLGWQFANLRVEFIP